MIDSGLPPPHLRGRAGGGGVQMYDAALIAGVFALVGILFNHRLALRRARQNAKREAGQRLKDAFIPLLTKVQDGSEFVQNGPSDSGPGTNISRLLKDADSTQSQAVTEFTFHLEGAEKKRFDEAWQYYNSYAEFKFLGLDDARQKFIDSVTAILKFTEI